MCFVAWREKSSLIDFSWLNKLHLKNCIKGLCNLLFSSEERLLSQLWKNVNDINTSEFVFFTLLKVCCAVLGEEMLIKRERSLLIHFSFLNKLNKQALFKRRRIINIFRFIILFQVTLNRFTCFSAPNQDRKFASAALTECCWFSH